MSSEDGSALGRPKGWITCLGAIVEEIGSIEDDGGGAPAARHHHQFAITAPQGTTTRRIVLACEHRQEMEQWVQALREMVLTCAQQPTWGLDSPSRRHSVTKAGKMMRMMSERSFRALSLRAEVGTVRTVRTDDDDDDDTGNAFLISLYQDDGQAPPRITILRADSLQEAEVFTGHMNRSIQKALQDRLREQDVGFL